MSGATGDAANGRAGRSAQVDAARVVLAGMGLSVADLLDAPPARPAVPTFAEYVPVVAAAVSVGTRRVYGSYWNRLLEQWAERRLDDPTPTQIEHLVAHTRAHVVIRRNARGGRGAGEHMVAALRCLYRHAERDRLISPADNPARDVAKPRRLPSSRRAIPDHGLAEINRVAASTGNDPILDSLLLRLHTETACRRGGALALRPIDLDQPQCLIRLREKGETTRWQPVSPTLMSYLLGQAQLHQIPPDEQLLRTAGGRPITSRRYDHLWARLGRNLSWVATQGISTHWLRHTTLTWVERTYGHAVAAAYAGHHGGGHGEGVTAVYTRAGIEEVAAALQTLTNEPHPLADRISRHQTW